MRELSPLAKQLLRAGQKATEPTETDRVRNQEALQARLGLPPKGESPAPSPTTPPTPTRFSWKVVSTLGAAGGVVAGLVYLSAPSPQPVPDSTSTPAKVTPRADEGSESTPPPLPTESPEERAPTDPAPQLPESPPSAPRKIDSGEDTTDSAQQGNKGSSQSETPHRSTEKGRLAEEVALLSQATSALHAGQAQKALLVLAKHREKFPQGVLLEERLAAQAQALCRLDQHAKARHLLERLPPSSPLAARTRRACSERQKP